MIPSRRLEHIFSDGYVLKSFLLFVCHPKRRISWVWWWREKKPPLPKGRWILPKAKDGGIYLRKGIGCVKYPPCHCVTSPL